MVLESHVKLCVTERDFGENFFGPPNSKMGPKWIKNRVFSVSWKIWSLIFTEVDP